MNTRKDTVPLESGLEKEVNNSGNGECYTNKLHLLFQLVNDRNHFQWRIVQTQVAVPDKRGSGRTHRNIHTTL